MRGGHTSGAWSWPFKLGAGIPCLDGDPGPGPRPRTAHGLAPSGEGAQVSHTMAGPPGLPPPPPQTAQQLDFTPDSTLGPKPHQGCHSPSFFASHMSPQPLPDWGSQGQGRCQCSVNTGRAAGVLGPVDASAPWMPVPPQDISLLSPAPSGCPCWTSS